MASRDKAAKFVELANKRVNKALKDIQLIGNLANRQNYEFTDEQAKKIMRALQQEVDIVKQSFQSVDEAGRKHFTLDTNQG
jgi:ABC-type Fe3+-hydroxamate transport system substrate-binding protein